MSTLKEKIYAYIKSLIAKYGQAFPSYPTLAKVAGCSSRHATDLVKQLEEEGRIVKEKRFTEAEGKVRQLSNRYDIVEQPQTEEKQPEQASSPYIKDLKTFKRSFIKSFDDDLNVSHYRHREFFEITKEWGVSEELSKEIFVHIKEYLPRMKSWVSLYWSLNRLKEYANTISCVGSWFNTVLQRRDHLKQFEVIGLTPIRTPRGTSAHPSGYQGIR